MAFQRIFQSLTDLVLTCLLDHLPSKAVDQPKPEAPVNGHVEAKSITQDYIWHRLAAFLRPEDILIAESGTAQFGFPDAKLPANTRYITQVYYGSIGYSVGSCLGAAIAKRDAGEKGRVVLVVGDGSLQLTVQEIGTMIRVGLENIKM